MTVAMLTRLINGRKSLEAFEYEYEYRVAEYEYEGNASYHWLPLAGASRWY